MVSLSRINPPIRPLGAPAQQYASYGPQPTPPPDSNTSLVRPAAAVASGVGGAAMLKGAIRPNVAGKVARAKDRVSGLDEQIAREMAYPKSHMHRGKIADLKRQRARAASQQHRIAAKAPKRQTPKLRMGRGAIGLAGVAGAAALWPKSPKPPKDPRKVPEPVGKAVFTRANAKRAVIPLTAAGLAGTTGYLVGTAKPRNRRKPAPAFDWRAASRSVPTMNDRTANSGKFTVSERSAMARGDFSELEARARTAMARNKRLLARAGERRAMED